MFLQLSRFSLLLLFASSCFAENDRTWLQVGSSFGAFHLQLKTADENSGWAFEAAGYFPPTLFGSTIIDRETNKEVDPMLNVLAISKLWSSPFSWGYADYGLGLGMGLGSWTKSCKEVDDSFDETYECDYYQGSRVGIPFQASAAFGKYVGLGVSLNAFVHSDDAQVRMLFTLPLGKFTR